MSTERQDNFALVKAALEEAYRLGANGYHMSAGVTASRVLSRFYTDEERALLARARAEMRERHRLGGEAMPHFGSETAGGIADTLDRILAQDVGGMP